MCVCGIPRPVNPKRHQIMTQLLVFLNSSLGDLAILAIARGSSSFKKPSVLSNGITSLMGEKEVVV